MCLNKLFTTDLLLWVRANLLDWIFNFLSSKPDFSLCTNSLKVSTLTSFRCSFCYPLNNLFCPHKLYLSTSLNNYGASAHIHTCLLTYHLQFTDLNVYVLTGSLICTCLHSLAPALCTYMHLCGLSYLCKCTNVCLGPYDFCITDRIVEFDNKNRIRYTTRNKVEFAIYKNLCFP